MDTSNRQLDIILGTLILPAFELPSDEWLLVLNTILGLCKPHLKYLSGFKTIQDIVKSHSSDSYNNSKVLTEELDRVKNLRVLRFNLSICLGDGVHRYLLLTQQGRWIYWKVKIDLPTLSLLETCSFREVAGFDLFVVVTKKQENRVALLESLYKILVETVEEKEIRLKKIKNTTRKVQAIGTRLGFVRQKSLISD